MASFYLCNRTSGKGSRLKISGINASAKVSEFRKLASKEIGLPQHEIELLYSGHSLLDDNTLESYGARPGVTVHALKKHDSYMHQDVPEKMDAAVVQQVVTALQSALINPAYRSTVERMLTDPDTLENIVAATPGLDKDPVAISMLQDPELLSLLADPTTSQKVVNAHPALGQAAMMVAAAVNEEGAKAGATPIPTGAVSRSARGTYSLDQMSDDEDMEAPGLGGAFPTSITPSILAAAIAAAGGNTSAALQQTAGSGTATTASQAASSMITSDFFRQAMAAAADTAAASSSSSSSTPAPAPTTPTTQEIPPHILQVQLEQLRDMGITDEAAARNALLATNGNLEATIALLFGDGGF